MLDITGVGYRANAQGSQPQAAARLQPRRRFARCRGIEIKTDNTTIGSRGSTNEGWPGGRGDPSLAQMNLQGQGIRYPGEFIFRKEGKK